MRDFRALLAIALSAAFVAAVACDSGGGSATPVAATPGTTASGTAASSPAANPTAARPTVGATELALAADLKDLRTLTITATDVPFGFRLRNDQPVTQGEVAAALIGVPELSAFIKGSDLQGAWATFYTREQPQTALSGIVYRFATPDSAKSLVSTIAGLNTSSYPAAISVERVQADRVGEVSQMMRYRLQGARTLEYTWVQGRLAGQIVLRYTGDVESPDDVALIVATARKQAEHMQSLAQ